MYLNLILAHTPALVFLILQVTLNFVLALDLVLALVLALVLDRTLQVTTLNLGQTLILTLS